MGKNTREGKKEERVFVKEQNDTIFGVFFFFFFLKKR
jgi:hypothetical protein